MLTILYFFWDGFSDPVAPLDAATRFTIQALQSSLDGPQAVQSSASVVAAIQ